MSASTSSDLPRWVSHLGLVAVQESGQRPSTNTHFFANLDTSTSSSIIKSGQPASKAGSSRQPAAARLEVEASEPSAQTLSRSQHGEASAPKKEPGTKPENKRPTTAAELEALLPGMKLYHDPDRPGRHLAPPLLNPEEAWVGGEHDEDDFDYGDIGDYEDDDDDYDSLLYSTEDEGDLDYESSRSKETEDESRDQCRT
jgi:hypothetical protein